ncbi:DUF1304 domain-containing protein [Alloscardovia theropitheci]|uniref:DUF1304 domain-containing protein n=2 Tax=Alloscardovia theropitheci TaxID=2496842 RepID=A0A4R0QYL1_9BIFI|nr:DUF1304 domain-containing protein [Alloscardovia theropitheci]
MIIGLIFAALAGALHVLIAYMEMFAWEGPLARKTFGGTPEEARPFSFYAYNQGLYNGFLAVEAFVGIVIAIFGSTLVGAALVIAAVASMLCAALGLVLKDSSYASAAIKQGTLPVIGLIFVILGLVL